MRADEEQVKKLFMDTLHGKGMNKVDICGGITNQAKCSKSRH